MDFEKAYANYMAGTATDEEKVFVEAEIDKARKLTSIIDGAGAEAEVIAPAEISDVRKAKIKHGIKTTVKTVLISAISLIVAIGAVCAGVFGTAASSAKKSAVYDRTAVQEIAVQFVKDNYDTSSGPVFVTEVDRDLKMSFKLKHSTYQYYIDVQNGTVGEVELVVNAKTGVVLLEDAD